MSAARPVWPVTALIVATVLAGCSSNEPAPIASATPETSPSSPTTATLPAMTTADSQTTAASAPPASSAPPTPIALPTTFVQVDKVIKDPDLGHEIKVLRMARGLPWPDPKSDEAQAFELVGVEMTWTPGVTYTAALRTVDFSIGSTASYPNRPDAIINPSLQAAGLTILPPEMPNGQTGTGWLVFKVDPKAATALRLDYTRPASRVTDSGQTFPKTVFSAQLVG